MSDHVKLLIVGQNPSTKTENNQTLSRLAKWMDFAGVRNWSFVNVGSQPGTFVPTNEDRHFLWRVLKVSSASQPVVALGGQASKVLTMFQINHLRLPHPSGLNRQLNDPRYEELAMGQLRQLVELHEFLGFTSLI